MKIKLPPFALVASLVGLSLLPTGCVTYTKTQNEARVPVHFASPDAAQKFYDAFLGTIDPPDRKNTVAVYVTLPFWYHRVPAGNVRYNTAIKAADQDGDGIISEAEAKDYADHSHRKKG